MAILPDSGKNMLMLRHPRKQQYRPELNQTTGAADDRKKHIFTLTFLHFKKRIKILLKYQCM